MIDVFSIEIELYIIESLLNWKFSQNKFLNTVDIFKVISYIYKIMHTII